MRYLPGHQVRGPRLYRRKVGNQDKAEICRQYTEGETTYALARAFGVSDATIGNVLAREGVERRTGSEAHRSHRVLSDAQELEVLRRYQAGETAKAIAEDFSVSTQPVFNALDRRGVPRNYRGVYESAKRFGLRVLSATQEAEACRRYEHGESVAAIADAMSVGIGTVDGALKRGGVEMRLPAAGERTAPETEAEVCRRYLKGETPKKISQETGVPRATISFVLKRNGIDPRHKIRYTPEQEAVALRRYLAGERVYEIASDLGISPAGIYPILKRRGHDAGRVARRLEWEEAQAANVIRSLSAYRKWRQAVLARDGRACQDCRAHSTFDNPLHVHHLQSFASILAEHRPIKVDEAERYAALWDTDNGITLCADCHRKAHASQAERFRGLT